MSNFNQEQYENDLQKRQAEHLQGMNKIFIPCLHDSCPECIGTGKKIGGEMCIHFISCSCPKCSPTY